MQASTGCAQAQRHIHVKDRPMFSIPFRLHYLVVASLVACGAEAPVESDMLASQGFALRDSRAVTSDRSVALAASATPSDETVAPGKRRRAELADPGQSTGALAEAIQVDTDAQLFADQLELTTLGASQWLQGKGADDVEVTSVIKTLEPLLSEFKKNVCWLGSYGRGVGTIPNQCDGEINAGLCYDRCDPGYHGVGPICWVDNYTRGVGSPWPCDSDEEYDAGLCYTQCAPGFHGVGPVCWGDGTRGVSYSRGLGGLLSCGPNLEFDAGLCYAPCNAGYSGVGPVCWGQCPSDFPVSCGAACAKDGESCAKAVGTQVVSSIEAVVDLILQDYGGAADAAMSAANSFNLPICH